MSLPPLTFPRAELERFFGAARPFVRAETLPATGSQRALTLAFADLGERLRTHRQERAAIYRNEAPFFNLFDFIKPKETVLSRILQFLLDPSGTHGQGELFLSLFLARLQPGKTFAVKQALLAREATTYTLATASHRRIDLTATMPGFILALENKKYTKEGSLQIEHYCQHLQNVAKENFCLIFLTRTGDDAQMSDHALRAAYKQKGQLALWTWQTDIKQWLADCHEPCGSEKVRYFLHDFAGYIDEFLAAPDPLPDDDEQPS